MDIHGAQKFSSFSWGIIAGGILALAGISPMGTCIIGVVLVTVIVFKAHVELGD